MEDSNFNKQYIYYYLLYEFWKGSVATKALKNIHTVYADAMKVSTCGSKVLKIGTVTYPTCHTPENDPPWMKNFLKETIKLDLYQCTRNLPQKLSTVLGYLNQIGKTYK